MAKLGSLGRRWLLFFSGPEDPTVTPVMVNSFRSLVCCCCYYSPLLLSSTIAVACQVHFIGGPACCAATLERTGHVPLPSRPGSDLTLDLFQKHTIALLFHAHNCNYVLLTQIKLFDAALCDAHGL